MFLPLLILVFWMGIYPVTFIDMMAASVDQLIDNHNAAMATSQGLTLADALGLD